MDKVLVITGGSKGIGRAATELFGQQGYRVINLSRSPSPVASVQQLSVDMSAPDWLVRLRQPLLQAVGQPGELCLVHNAALLAKDNVRDISAADLQRALGLNVVAAAELNTLLLPLMQPGSSILYVGSTLSEKAVANSCSYVVSKHALLGLMRATCQDLMGSGVHTACLCPGFTDTEMLRDHLGQDEAVLAAIATGNAFGRLVEPAEIARALLFCAREPVINGAVLHANLGQRES